MHSVENLYGCVELASLFLKVTAPDLPVQAFIEALNREVHNERWSEDGQNRCIERAKISQLQEVSTSFKLSAKDAETGLADQFFDHVSALAAAMTDEKAKNYFFPTVVSDKSRPPDTTSEQFLQSMETIRNRLRGKQLKMAFTRALGKFQQTRDYTFAKYADTVLRLLQEPAEIEAFRVKFFAKYTNVPHDFFPCLRVPSNVCVHISFRTLTFFVQALYPTVAADPTNRELRVRLPQDALFHVILHPSFPDALRNYVQSHGEPKVIACRCGLS